MLEAPAQLFTTAPRFLLDPKPGPLLLWGADLAVHGLTQDVRQQCVSSSLMRFAIVCIGKLRRVLVPAVKVCTLLWRHAAAPTKWAR
jgi:hypothetical protein